MKVHLQLGSCSLLEVPPLEGAQVESRVHEPLQLVQVSGLVSRRRSSCRVPSHVPDESDDDLSIKFLRKFESDFKQGGRPHQMCCSLANTVRKRGRT